MADILIRKVSEETKERLRRRAERRGKSLEADLRETLERIAKEEAKSDDDAPLGTWLFENSRPGVDLDKTLRAIRKSRVRPVDFS
jgi:plasmid stability protein